MVISMIEILFEVYIEIDKKRTGLFHWKQFHVVENRQVSTCYQQRRLIIEHVLLISISEIDIVEPTRYE